MADTTRTGDDLWSEEGEDDNEQTQVARNPLLRSSPAPAADLSRSQARSLSSFGTPRSSWPPGTGEHGPSGAGRPSLYERLRQTGALDEELATAAKRESSRPLGTDLQRSGVHPQQLPPAPDLRDLAEALEGSDGRDSAEELRDSDVQMLAPSSQIDTKPLRPLPTPPRSDAANPAGPKTTGQTPLPRGLPPIPRSNGNGQVSSILLGPGASMRNDATERFSHMPSTHPLANSLAPTATSVRPLPAGQRMPTWLVVAAALLLVGLGAGIGRWRSGSVDSASSQTSATSAPIASPSVPATAMTREAVVPDAVAVSDAPATVAVPSTSPADEPVEETPAQARKRERDRRRAERASGTAGGAQSPALPASLASASDTAANPLSGRGRSATNAGVPASAVMAQPTREQVVTAMDRVLPELTRCVGEKHGAATVTMTVRSSGAVTYALVGGSFAGTPEGSCIARVIRQAQFPAFSDPSIRVSYPFQL